MADLIEKKFLGTEGVQKLITNTRTEIAAAEKAAKDYADSLADNYDAAGTAQTKVDELANGQVKANKEAIGTMDNLDTTAKSDLVSAINEVRNAVSVGGTAAAVTMEEKTSDLGAGVLKAYVLKQGENTVGTINIPKDMVVQSGEVVTNPEGQAAGTYIKLTLANATNDVIYVNVGTLVDIYKAKASAAQVQIAIDAATREISATIVAGSVTATELAANSVVTAKIADGNVTLAKLSTDVQTSLGKAHEHSNKTILDSYTMTQSALLSAAEVYADTLDNDMDTRVAPLEAAKHTHANADKLDTYTMTQTDLINEVEGYAEDYADGVSDALIERITPLETAKHTHTNATQLDTYDKTQAELLAAAAADAKQKADNAQSAAELYADSIRDDYVDPAIEGLIARITPLETDKHTHANKTVLDSYTKTETQLIENIQAYAENYAEDLDKAMDTRVKALEAIDHDHSNKTVLDSYDKTQTELLTSAFAEAEAYADGIVEDQVGQLSNRVDQLNTAMDTRVKALEAVSYVEISATDIDNMFKNN